MYYHKLIVLKQHTFKHRSCCGQESRVNLAGSCFKVSHMAANRYSAKTESSSEGPARKNELLGSHGYWRGLLPLGLLD